MSQQKHSLIFIEELSNILHNWAEGQLVMEKMIRQYKTLMNEKEFECAVETLQNISLIATVLMHMHSSGRVGSKKEVTSEQLETPEAT